MTDIDLGVTMRELLQQPLYKEWFLKPPRLRVKKGRNWRVAVLTKQGKWRFVKLEFKTYPQAANFMLKLMREGKTGLLDFAVVSKLQAFRPPARYRRVEVKKKNPSTGRVVVVGHKRELVEKFSHPVLENQAWKWCAHCRRPTRWGYFRTHHALSGKISVIRPYRLRCVICGVSDDQVKRLR